MTLVLQHERDEVDRKIVRPSCAYPPLIEEAPPAFPRRSHHVVDDSIQRGQPKPENLLRVPRRVLHTRGGIKSPVVVLEALQPIRGFQPVNANHRGHHHEEDARAECEEVSPDHTTIARPRVEVAHSTGQGGRQNLLLVRDERRRPKQRGFKPPPLRMRAAVELEQRVGQDPRLELRAKAMLGLQGSERIGSEHELHVFEGVELPHPIPFLLVHRRQVPPNV